MKRNQALAALLLLAASCSVVSCGAEPSAQPDSTQASSPVQDTLTSAEAESNALDIAVAALPQADYGGHEFKIMDRSEQYSSVWYTYDVFSEGENGEPINDAVYQRNRILEDAVNIKIREEQSVGPTADMKKLITAGDDAYDLFTDGMSSLVSMTTGNMLYNLNDVSQLRLSEPWWDQQMRTEFNILDKLYIMTGDISIMDNEATWCILFNKTMAESFDFGDLYQTVRDGKWTLSMMQDMMKAVSSDLNGDGAVGAEDRFGYLTEAFNIYALWCGSGNKIVSLNESGLPTITMFNDRSAAIYDKVLEMQFDPNTTGIAGKNPFPGYSDLNDCFNDNRALFIYGAMSLIPDYRDSETNFGVLPAPKYDESQSQYYNTFSYCNMTGYCIPVTASDINRTGTIMEAMADISQYILTPAYYDITLKGKSVRDQESEEMIDLILATRSYDLGPIFQWGSGFSIFNSATDKKIGTFASQYEKGEKSMVKAIDKYIADISENE
ncbi:MAG: hypothetical protein MJ175_02825 [Clostridia bacterium]|nr:hypothetical protein [Clostridia bacterium]